MTYDDGTVQSELLLRAGCIRSRKRRCRVAQLTARINKTEQALTAARAEKIILDKQLEASRQQLLASAAGTR